MAEVGRFRLISAQDAQVKRENSALALKMAGLSYVDIAAHQIDGHALFSTPEDAEQAVSNAMTRVGIEGERGLELARLDALQRAYWRKALAGDNAAAKTVLQVQAQRQRVLSIPENENTGPSALDLLREQRRA
jgi:hypothetical protein